MTAPTQVTRGCVRLQRGAAAIVGDVQIASGIQADALWTMETQRSNGAGHRAREDATFDPDSLGQAKGAAGQPVEYFDLLVGSDVGDVEPSVGAKREVTGQPRLGAGVVGDLGASGGVEADDVPGIFARRCLQSPQPIVRGESQTISPGER